MDTRTVVQNALWPYAFGIICIEAGRNENPDGRLGELYKSFEGYLKEWRDQIKDHQENAMKKNLEKCFTHLIDLCRDAKACDGKGGNSTTKTIGVLKGIMENVEHVKLEGFHDFAIAAQHLEQVAYEKFPEQYDAQFDSGSIERKVIKGIEWMKGQGYYG